MPFTTCRIALAAVALVAMSAGAFELGGGDKAIVVVRKGGSGEVIKARGLTYAALYRGQEFDLTGAKRPLVYLTPTGAVEPVVSAKNGQPQR